VTEQGRGLTHVSEILPGMEEITVPQREPEPIKALTVQGKHHFTRLKQIDALAGIGDDPNADMGFMARLLTLCSLPRTDPGSRLQYKRQNGPYKLIMIAGGDNKLPFGNLPRLLLAWVSTEAVRTKERELILGNSLAAFMRQLGMHSDSGGDRGDRTRLRHQVDRLFNAHVQLIYEAPGHKATASSSIADRTELWWNYRKPEQDTLWQSRIFLGEAFFNEIIAHPVPLDMRILREMKRSSLGIDLYMWLSYKTFTLYTRTKKSERLPWERLYVQFGADPAKVTDKYVIRDFRKDILRELRKLKLCWPTLDYATPTGCLEIRPCAPSISPKAIAR
jgi:hypothetical protein